MKFKFGLGDTVRSKKLGPPMEGTIEIVLNPNEIKEMAKYVLDIYPNALNNPAYMVNIDKPIKPFTLEEYKLYRQELGYSDSEEETKQKYDTLKETSTIYYPEDDLEIVRYNV